MLRNVTPMLAEHVDHQAVEQWEKHKKDYTDPSKTGSYNWYHTDNRFSIFVAAVAGNSDRMFRPMVRVVMDFHSWLVHRLRIDMLLKSIHLLLHARLYINWLLLHARLDIHLLLLHARLDIHWLLLHARLDINWLLLYARILK